MQAPIKPVKSRDFPCLCPRVVQGWYMLGEGWFDLLWQPKEKYKKNRELMLGRRTGRVNFEHYASREAVKKVTGLCSYIIGASVSA